MFHAGHLNVLQQAAKHGSTLIVGVCSDEFVLQSKHKLPVISEEHRLSIVKNIKCVTDAFLYDQTLEAVGNAEFDLFAHGPDISERTKSFASSLGRPMVEIPRLPGISTSYIREQGPPVIGIDFHDTISYAPKFFKSLLEHYPTSCVYVVTGTPQSQRDSVVEALKELGIGPSMYSDVLCGFEYEHSDMSPDHFYRMAQHKHRLIMTYNISVYFDDNPFYASYLRNFGINVFQTILSDSYLEHYRSHHPHFTCNLQSGQFNYLQKYLSGTTPLPLCSDLDQADT